MDGLFTRAQLVGYDPSLDTIGTVVPRAEFVETAARGEFPATLLLDLESGDGDRTAHARVAVDWDKDTLDQLLASTKDEEIALWFDERELAQAFDDVEGHGLRERAAVLAVAVTAAGIGTTPAVARVAPQGPLGPLVATGEQPSEHMARGQSQSTQGPAVQSMGTQRGEQLNQQVSGGQAQGPSSEAPAATSTGDSGLSTGELAAIAGAGAILISAAGFGFTRKHNPPVRPA
jgi:hypothetical protein